MKKDIAIFLFIIFMASGFAGLGGDKLISYVSQSYSGNEAVTRPPPGSTPTPAGAASPTPTGGLPTPTATPIPGANTPTPTRTPTPTAAPTSLPIPTPTLIACPPYTSPLTYTLKALAHDNNVPPDDQRPELRFSVNGYHPAAEEKMLVDYLGDTDIYLPPNFATLLTRPSINDFIFSNVYKANNETDKWKVQILGIQTAPGEDIKVPASYHHPASEGSKKWQAYVLYAKNNNLTLKYSATDSIADGYTVYIEGICIDPNLIQAYNNCRSNPPAAMYLLPVIEDNSVVGKTNNTEIRVAIRDAGEMMDPRSRKDWWEWQQP